MAEIHKRLLPGLPVWDIACDHGLLGLAALADDSRPEVVFVDRVPHIIEALRPKVKDPRGRLICLDAQMLQEPLAGTVVIAGVGGELMQEMIEAWRQNKVLHARRLVVCPHKDEKDLAHYLSELKDWRSVESVRVEENGRERPVMVYDKVEGS